jgi:hypothetical protein
MAQNRDSYRRWKARRAARRVTVPDDAALAGVAQPGAVVGGTGREGERR